MPSLSSQDRVSLCRFTSDDSRRCRTPRISTSPDFCFYHAQKEAHFRANENLATDLSYFFSGDYLSANDLNTALSRVFVAVARGHVKPRAARTLAYLAQTMLQTLHLAQNELISACGDSKWHNSVVKSINANYDYRFSSTTQPAQPQPATPQAQTPPQPPTPSPTPAPASTPVQSAPPVPQLARRHTAVSPPQPNSPASQPQPPVSARAVPAPQSASQNQPVSQDQPAAQTANPTTPPATQSTPPPRPATQPRDPYAVHYGPNHRLIVDGKPF